MQPENHDDWALQGLWNPFRERLGTHMNQQKTCFKSSSLVPLGQRYAIQFFPCIHPLTLPHLHCSSSCPVLLGRWQSQARLEQCWGGLSWALSGSRSRQSSAHIHVLSRTPRCLPGCHKLLGRRVLGCKWQFRVWALLWLFLQWNKALAHIKGPQCCQEEKLLRLRAVLAIVAKPGESFLTNSFRRNHWAPRKWERKHKMEDEVRTGYWGSKVDFCISCRCYTKAICHILPCVTEHCRWPSGKGGKGRALVVITENLQKAMAVCFQPHPDPVIMEALIITCLLKLKNRGQKFTLHTQHCSYELWNYRADLVTTEVRYSRDITGFGMCPVGTKMKQSSLFV